LKIIKIKKRNIKILPKILLINKNKIYMAKIGIDIDETLSFTNKAIIKYFQKNINPNIKENPFYKKEAQTNEEIKKYLETFHKIILEEKIDFIDPIEDSKEIIEKLDKNNKIYLITARHIKLSEPTKKWVEKHYRNIFFEDIKHLEYKGLSGAVKDKDEICKEIGIDVLIDDNLNNAIKCSKRGIPVILFDLNGEYDWNKIDQLPKNIIRAHNWKDVYNILNTKYNIF
jgi:uncharacterized HAD superfamily protein